MASSKRYFQLTSDILLEYNYTTTEALLKNESGDRSDVSIDLRGKDRMTVVGNGYDNGTYFYVNTSDDDEEEMKKIYADQSNFVIPINSSHTKFIKYNNYNKSKGTYTKYSNSKFELKPFVADGEVKDGVIDIEDDDCDIVFDKIRLHFTSKNFMGNYNGVIIQAYIYDRFTKKINLMSFEISRQAHYILNPEPMLLNQKMYTTYIDAKIVSTDCLLYYIDKQNKKITNDSVNSDSDDDIDKYIGTRHLLNHIIDYRDGNGDGNILRNSTINFEIYGIKGSYENSGYEAYTCERLNSVVVKNKDSYDCVGVEIKEAEDGDYYVIKATTTTNRFNKFSNFIKSLSETYESYLIMHELTLTEYFVNQFNQLRSEITHREQYLINAAKNGDDENAYELNSDELDDEFLYRPICKYGSRCVKFTITDVLKIVDTYSNTTIVKTGKCDCTNPYKYGKHMNKIYLGEVPSQINVYNKRSTTLKDEDIESITFGTNPNYIKIDSTNSTNGSSSSSGGVQLVTTNVGITAFCETTDIRVTVTDMVK
jgi:hypothetical protein